MADGYSAYRPIPKNRLITQEGYPYIMIGSLLFLISLVMGWFLFAFLMAAMTLFVCFFFRNPTREINEDSNLIMAPADGRILNVEEIAYHDQIEGPAVKISTFMSVFNCHVNRLPVSGQIEKVIYNRGKFFVASLDKASKHNESNTIVMKDACGRRLVIVQIAGLIARRIVCYLKEGIDAMKCQRLGVICFGSRVDLYLPKDAAKIDIEKGRRVYAGKTILGRWS